MEKEELIKKLEKDAEELKSKILESSVDIVVEDGFIKFPDGLSLKLERQAELLNENMSTSAVEDIQNFNKVVSPLVTGIFGKDVKRA